MKAMIMAAGYGTRLGDITKSVPKILVEVNGRSVLEIILKKLKSFGFDDIIINVHYMADQVEEKAISLAKTLGISISFSDERDELLDTGGGLYKAKDFFSDEPFLLYNGDILTDLDLKKLYDFHIRRGSSATVAIRERPGNRFFLIDKKGFIRGWTNRKSGMDIVTIDEPMELDEIASMAINVLSPTIFSYMKEGKYTLTSILLDLAAKESVTTFRHDTGFWIDMGTPEKLDEARKIY